MEKKVKQKIPFSSIVEHEYIQESEFQVCHVTPAHQEIIAKVAEISFFRKYHETLRNYFVNEFPKKSRGTKKEKWRAKAFSELIAVHDYLKKKDNELAQHVMIVSDQPIEQFLY